MKPIIEIEEIKIRRQALNMSLNLKGIFLSSGFGNQASFNVPPHSLKHKISVTGTITNTIRSAKNSNKFFNHIPQIYKKRQPFTAA